MRFDALENTLSARGVHLEIVATNGSWAASVADSKGRVTVPTVMNESLEKALRILDESLGGTVRRRSRFLHDTTALNILKAFQAEMDIRHPKRNTFVVTIQAPRDTIQTITLHCTDVTLWFALNEAIAAVFATISAMHLARTIGH